MGRGFHARGRGFTLADERGGVNIAVMVIAAVWLAVFVVAALVGAA